MTGTSKARVERQGSKVAKVLALEAQLRSVDTQAMQQLQEFDPSDSGHSASLENKVMLSSSMELPVLLSVDAWWALTWSCSIRFAPGSVCDFGSWMWICTALCRCKRLKKSWMSWRQPHISYCKMLDQNRQVLVLGRSLSVKCGRGLALSY
jgi:hypothetical protein